jgi:hypothetical protein
MVAAMPNSEDREISIGERSMKTGSCWAAVALLAAAGAPGIAAADGKRANARSD